MKQKKDNNGTWYFYGIPLTLDTFLNALYIIAIIASICVLANTIIVTSETWFEIAGVFLLLCAFLYYHGMVDDIQRKDMEIAELKSKIAKLESRIEFYEGKNGIDIE